MVFSTFYVACLASDRSKPLQQPDMSAEKRPRSRKRTAVEEEILKVAADMFSQRGYQATTLDDIALAAGISRAAFYSYFPSKEELLRRMYNQVISSTQTALERIAAEDLPVPEKLRRIIRHQVHYLATNMPLAQVFFSEIFNLPQEMERSVTQANRTFSQVIERVVEEGVKTGVLISIHPQRFTYAVMGMWNWMHRWYRPGGEWAPDTLAEEFIRILEAGYLSQKAESSTETLLAEVRALRAEMAELRATLFTTEGTNVFRKE